MSDTKEVVMETLYCEVGEHDFEREQKRGRKPTVCPTCKSKIEAAKEAERKENDGRRVRRKFANKYTVVEGELEEGGMALYLPTNMFSDPQNILKYAKEFEIISIDQESGVVVVNNSGTPTSTSLKNLCAYEVERIEVEDSDEEIYTEDDLDMSLVGDDE